MDFATILLVTSSDNPQTKDQRLSDITLVAGTTWRCLLLSA